MSYGLLLLRVVAGGTMFAHGAQKLFGWWGGPGTAGFGGWLGSLGFRATAVLALLTGLAEAGGLLFALGLVTPFAAFGIIVVMVTAISTVHWSKGFFNGAGGYEFNLLLIAVAAGVAAIGPGRFSIDRLIGWDDNISGLWWGVGVLGAGIIVALLNIAVFRRPRTIQEAAPAT